jgi:CheY-like chemotaxis protein
VDLLLTDLNMPQMNGRELVSMMSNSSPETPVFVISGAVTLAELKEMETEYNNVRVFAKPLLTRELIAGIEEELSHKEIPDDADLAGSNLLNLLQLLHLKKKSVQVDIKHDQGEGCITLKSGEPVTAQFGDDESEESIFTMLALNDSIVSVEMVHYSGPDKVSLTFSQLLNEFIRRREKAES